MTNQQVAQNVLSGYRMGKPVSIECPDQLYEIMHECWDSDPVRRPTFDHLQDYLLHFDIASEQSYAESIASLL